MSNDITSPKIICVVGLCCIDDIYVVENYPLEDTDQRCLAYYKQRGGNASNNCTILGMLEASPSYLGVIANSFEQNYIKDDFRKFGIDTSLSIIDGYECPRSCVIVSKKGASRTIIHSNNKLPELSYDDFIKVKIENYSWIHFEGRNINEIKKMMEYIQNKNKTMNKKIIVSIEIEKMISNMESLVLLANVVFISKDFAQLRGCQNMDEALLFFSKYIAADALLICPWGDQGASAYKNGSIYKCPSYPPAEVNNTLGAGDTFIASTIYAHLCGENIESSINFGCKIAGAKVGINGWDNFWQKLIQMDYVKNMKKKFKDNFIC